MTLHSLCRAFIGRMPADGDPAICFEGRWRPWRDYRGLVDDLNAWLDAGGIAAGARVGFAPRNRPSSLIALIALLSREVTVVMIHSYQSQSGMAQDMARHRLTGFVCDRSDFGAPIEAAARGAGLAAFALHKLDEERIALCGGNAVAEGDSGQAPGIWLLTSGTTGAPKHHPFGYDQVGRMVSDNIGGAAPSPDPIPALLYFPLSNISGLRAGLAALLGGRPVVLLPRFTIADWHAHVMRYRLASASIPTAGISMALSANIAPRDLSSLNFVMTGAAPLAVETQRAFERRFGVPVLLAYGATEFGGPVTQVTLADRERYGEAKLGSVGRPYAGNAVRIRHPQSDHQVPPAEIGLVEVRSARMGPDWIPTTDLGAIDGDGFLYLHGRADGAINRGGFKIVPETIEAVLMRHADIDEVAVVGVPDARLGEVPAAAVVMRGGVLSPDIGALVRHVRQTLYATQVPARWRIVTALPRNASLKIDRVAVRMLFEADAKGEDG
ncbi:class I adenylate-forming enzyme family protein [Sphingomonas flavalba]|uniref:class I adenylate-forming enzyme family protein n=1 Tax=Sphingomonas flavalba TaxID=2559804 RepID=UPI0039E13713